MTDFNALTEHVQEFCEQIEALEEQFSLKIVIDHTDETIMLVSTRDEHTPIAWLGKDEIKCSNDYVTIDYHSLAAVLEPVVEEEDLEA